MAEIEVEIHDRVVVEQLGRDGDQGPDLNRKRDASLGSIGDKTQRNDPHIERWNTDRRVIGRTTAVRVAGGIDWEAGGKLDSRVFL